MSRTLRWTVSDLELLPDDDKRREIIDGELYVSKQPDWYHQVLCIRLGGRLDQWTLDTGRGMASGAPGVIFSPEDAVAPDLVWMSNDRLLALDESGHVRAAPELVVEVISPGATNARRDREAKLKLYSQRGVLEYWIVDWRLRQVEVYRRRELALDLVATLRESDALSSPLLPGFVYPLAHLFDRIPTP